MPAPLGPPALVAHSGSPPAALTTPPFHDDLDLGDLGHGSPEILEETLIATLDHDQELYPRE
jgi:hypothetical protein